MSLHRKTFSQLSSPSSKASRTFQFGRNVKMSVKLDHSEDEEGNSGSGVPMAETDRFGFILGNGETDSDGPCPELVRHREAKWLNLILQWDQVIEKKSSKVKGQCQKGIPASLRAKCWPLLCGAMDRKKNNTDLYNSLDQTPGQQGWIDIIKRDTDRQFPFHEMFQSKDGHGQKDLLRVLKAYTLFRPEEGYCQAQGPVAAVLLMNMPAEEAFWCLVQISELYLPGYYSPLLEGVLFDAAILSSVLKKLCPAAHKHLKKQGVEPLMFATDWLMCLYSRHLPFNTLLRVWDLFFCYGVRVLFQVAVVLVRRCLGEGRLRKECDGQMETLERLRGVKECVQNEQTEAFIHEVCSVPLSVTDLQKQTEKEIEKWKKERPDSTFDPRRRCYGYRMAWEREQQKQKESEKKQRHRGNLSLPLMRSHSSLSPSVLRKKWRKRGSRTDAEEWDGGGRNFSQLTEESDEEEMRRRSVCGVIGEQRAKQERLSDEFYTHKQKDHNISPQCPEVVVSPCCEMPDVFEEPSQDTCSTPHTQSEKDSDSLREVDKVHIPMDNHKEETGTSLDQQDDDSSAERGQSDEKEKITENVVEETAQTHEQDIKEQTHEDQQNVENKEHQNEENTDKETCEDEQIIEKQECHSEQNVEIKMTSAHFEESTPHVETSQLNYNLQEEEIQTVSSKQEEEIQLESNNKVGETQRAACTQETTETEDFQKVKTCQDNQQSDETNIQNQENISEVEQTHVIQEDQRTHTSEDQNEENLHSERQEEEEMPIHTAPEEEEEAQPINEKNTEVDEEEFQQEVINDRDILEDTETAKEKTDSSETCEGTVENPSNDDMEKEEDGEDMTLEERDGDDHTPVEEMQVSEAALTSSSETEKETTIQHPTESIPPLSTTDPVQHCSQQTEQEENEEITLSPGPEAQSDHPKHNDMDDTVRSNESEHSQVESKEVEVTLGSDNPEQSEVGVSDAVEPLEHECDATPPYRSTEDSNLDSSAVAASGNNSEVDKTDGPENKDRCELNATEESQNGEGDICKSGSLVHVETESSNPESSEVHVATESGNIESSEVHVSTGSGDPECKAVDPAGESGNPLHDSACAIPDNSQELESPSSVTASKSPNPNVPPAHLCLRRTSSSRSSYPTILSEDTFRVPKQMPPDHTHTEKQTRTPLAEQSSPLMCHAEMNTTEQSKPDSTQDTHTQPNSASPTKTPKLLGLFRRLRGETNKTPVPKILIQDFSEKEEKLTAKERRRRKRERERKEKEEKERKKREKEMEKDKPKERKKPQTRGKSFQILNRKCAGNDVSPGNNDSQTIRPRRNSAPFAENYF